MATNYDFRILIESKDGQQLSFGTASFVYLEPNTSKVLTTSESVAIINRMQPIQYFNGKTYETASSLYDGKNVTSFSETNLDGSDYQYLSASIKDNISSGSILFHSNTTPTSTGDILKRYKFFGNKVCNVLGVPENYWIYADKFRLTNTGSESNYLSGDVLAQSIHLSDNFTIANRGSIESDLPLKHATDTDRWVKWVNNSGSLPTNDMLIGYSNQNDRYEIRMQNENLLISSSNGTTASGNFRIEKDLHLYGNKIYGDSDNNTYIDFGSTTANEINLYSNNREQVNVGYSGVTINEGGENIDFRVESDGDPRCLTVQGGENRVGIGMSAMNAAVAKLDVRGDVGNHDYGTALFRANSGQTGSITLQSDSGTVFTMAVIEDKTALGLGAIGVPNAVKDKDYPFKISEEGKVSVTGSFSLEATMPAYHTIGASIGSDTDVFLGFGPSISTFPEDTDTDDQDTRITAAFDGYVKRVILKGNTNLGTLNTLKLAKAGSGTAASAVDDNVIASSMAGNMATANVPVAFNGTRNNHSFSAGDTLAFKFSPGQVLSSTQIDGVVVLMYDVTDD